YLPPGVAQCEYWLRRGQWVRVLAGARACLKPASNLIQLNSRELSQLWVVLACLFRVPLLIHSFLLTWAALQARRKYGSWVLPATAPPSRTLCVPSLGSPHAEGIIRQKKSSRAIGEVVNDDRADWREAWALVSGSVAYIWQAGTKAGIVQDSLAACGFETRAQIIWAKNNFAIGRGHYHCKHEPCWYVVRKGSTASWVGDHSQTTLWQIDKNL